MVDTTGPTYQAANFRGASGSASKSSKRKNKRSSSRGKRK